MPLWDSFAGAISSLKKVTGSKLSEEEERKEQAFHNTVRDALTAVDREISKIPGVDRAQKTVANTGDFLLKLAVGLNQKVLSPYIFRPVSTLALLTDTNSPLYKKGEYEEGFQFNDIKSAYDRSAKVSTMQALTKSDLIPFIKPLSSMVLSTGDIDVDEVDLWDDNSIQKNYVDNTVGRWFTGIGDFVVGNAALGGVGKLAKLGARTGGAQVGLNTANKTVNDLANDMDTGILYGKSNGAQGSLTVSGTHMNVLAESKDYGVITDMVGKYSTNGRLVSLVRDASTPEAVRDLILADKGYLPALERLSTTAPDELFELGAVASQITS
jgi:hypothetical protein